MSLLYNCLLDAASSEKKTLTLQDSIDCALPYTMQTQINQKAGLTYASGLRAALRQDPDILMIGDLPDLETARLAVEAALTGHLALSTLSVGDAASGLRYLLDMGLPPYLLTTSLIGVAAMRLCRKICETCKEPTDVSQDATLSYVRQLAREGGYDVPDDAVFQQGRGCERCRNRGYLGRVPLYEVLTLTPALTEAVLRNAPAEEITQIAVAGGMRTLMAAGMRKAVEGQTTVEEVLRAVSVTF